MGPEPNRLPAWSDLSPAERAAQAGLSRARVAGIGRDLHAVAAPAGPSPAVADGALAGLPYAAKDLFDVPGRAPTCGLAAPGPVSDRALAAALRRLDAAGAVRVAYAEMTELAYEPSGCNPARGSVRNPWDAAAIPGGSSSGSAALVASGAVFLALGSDTGGSVRIPAQCCGITALKPSAGAIPVEGAMALAPSLDTIGLMARDAADLEPVFRVLGGAGGSGTLRRVAVLHDFGVSPGVAAAVEALRAIGVVVEDGEGGETVAEADRHALAVLQAEAARTHRAFLESPAADPTLRRRLLKGLAIGDADLAASLSARDALARRFLREALGGADAALLPVMPIGTSDMTETDPHSPRFQPRILYALSRFTRFVNFLGLPALALPAGFDRKGRPRAVQLVGRPGADAGLLALGRRFQDASGWHGRAPGGQRRNQEGACDAPTDGSASDGGGADPGA